MRTSLFGFAAVILTVSAATQAHAQGYWYGNTRVVPYVTPFPAPPTSFVRSYASPLGY